MNRTQHLRYTTALGRLTRKVFKSLKPALATEQDYFKINKITNKPGSAKKGGKNLPYPFKVFNSFLSHLRVVMMIRRGTDWRQVIETSTFLQMSFTIIIFDIIITCCHSIVDVCDQ